jgi:SAM-dependent methyltransferase
MTDSSPKQGHPLLTATLAACAAGELAPNVALARLLGFAETAQAAEKALATFATANAGDAEASERLATMLRLWQETPGAWQTLQAVLRQADHDQHALHPRQWGEAFDRAAGVSAEAGVALYSLGRADLLEAATDSIVQRLDGWGLLAADTAALDLGCGTGRLARALAPRLKSVVGCDVSGAMLAIAVERSAKISNLLFQKTDGCDLAPFAAAAFDLVLAVDVFPYLVCCQGDLVGRYIAEARRVLSARGSLVVLNYSYRGDDAADLDDLDHYARANAFELVRVARGDFAFWDGRTFHLRRKG